jgi:hypothetical protein
MRSDYPQPAREPLTCRGPPGQPSPIEGPQPPGEHREQGRTGPLPETPGERLFPGRKRADRAVDQGIEVGTEPRAGPREQPVG